MKKIISLFKRNYDGDRLVRNEVTPGAEWVQAGEGQATVKIDGTCCLVKNGLLYKRYDAKKGRTPPDGFMPAQDEPDPETGHWPGWLAVDQDAPEDKWHFEALFRFGEAMLDGTYELVGPKVQGNPYRLGAHEFIRHGLGILNPPRDFDGLKQWLSENELEGIVWWHEDGRMVKIKRKDFGLKWPTK